MYSPSCPLCQWLCQLHLREPWCASPVWPPPFLRRSSPLSASQICDLEPGIQRRVWDKERLGKMGTQDAPLQFTMTHVTNVIPVKRDLILLFDLITLSLCDYLKLSLWGSSNNDHPLSNIWALCWSNLRKSQWNEGEKVMFKFLPSGFTGSALAQNHHDKYKKMHKA